MASSLDSSVGAVDALVAALDGLEAVDLSPTLRSTMPRFFAHPEFHIIDDARLSSATGTACRRSSCPEHVGPHVDAPAHVVLERPRRRWTRSTSTALWGRAVVVDVSDRDWKPGDLLDVDDLMGVAGRRRRHDPRGRRRARQLRLEPPPARRRAGVQWWSSNAPGSPRTCAASCTTSACARSAPTTRRATWGGSTPSRRRPSATSSTSCPRTSTSSRTSRPWGSLPPVVFFAALPLKIANGTGSPLRPVAFVPKR